MARTETQAQQCGKAHTMDLLRLADRAIDTWIDQTGKASTGGLLLLVDEKLEPAFVRHIKEYIIPAGMRGSPIGEMKYRGYTVQFTEHARVPVEVVPSWEFHFGCAKLWQEMEVEKACDRVAQDHTVEAMAYALRGGAGSLSGGYLSNQTRTKRHTAPP